MNTSDIGYEYKEFYVRSYDDIMDIIARYNRFYHLPRPSHDGEPDTQAFYRGQANASWEIEPSISFANRNEPSIIRDFIVPDQMSLFETIAYIQHHHGSKSGTRFIDFSTDPDIAAFFACDHEQHMERDGALFVCLYRPHKPEWYTAIIMAELANQEALGAMTVGQLSGILFQRYPAFHERFQNSLDELSMFLVSFLDHGFMVLPDKSAYKNNHNMERQKGCFYICGVDFQKKLSSQDRWLSMAGKNAFIPHSAVYPDHMKSGRSVLKLIIPAGLKPKILHHLASKGITRKYLFPENCQD